MMKKHSRALSFAVAALMLTACSGSDDPIRNAPPAPQGDTFAITSTNGSFNFVTFNRATPTTLSTSVPITGLAPGDVIVGADIRPADNNFYAVTRAADGSGKVYLISRTTGGASAPVTLLSPGPMGMGTTPTILTGDTFGVDFNPVPDRLRVTSNTGQNFRINLGAAAGAATTIVDGNLVLNTGAALSVAEVGYRLSFATTCNTTLYYIDPVSDQLLVTSDPNGGTIRTVGSGLGVGDVTAVGGFEIMTTGSGPMFTDTALALLTVGGATSLYTIDLLAGTATISPAGSFPTGTTFVGLGISPPPTPTAQAMGNLVAVTENNALISFNTGGSPAKLCTTEVPVTGLAMGENLLDIDQRSSDGNVYGLTDQGRIYIVDPATGVASNGLVVAGLTMNPMALYSIDFNPAVDQLRIVDTDGQNIAVVITPIGTPTTATANVQTAINGAGTPVVTAVAYTNAVNGTTTTRLFDIDSGNDQLAIQNPAPSGALTAPVSLGLPMDVESGAGFDINGLTNQAFAGLNLAGASATSFATINLPPTFVSPAPAPATPPPVATIAGTIAGGAKVRGFAIVNRRSQASQATLLAVSSGNTFFTVRAQDPTTPVAPVATPTSITGLNGETIVGIDQRPANGLIYILTDASKLYTLDTTTGAATLVSTLSVPLDGSPSYGVDFNPVPDRLRITSTAGQNLRVNVDNGAVIVDGPLNPGTPMVPAVAYANNSVFPSATTLFDIDTVANTLSFQFPPNAGTLVQIGSLGMTMFTPTASFDIVGGDNSFALAALQPMGMMDAQSQLFVINLATGAATPQPAMGNTIGPMGTVVSSATFLLNQLP